MIDVLLLGNQDGFSASQSDLPNTFVGGFGGEDIPKDVDADEREERRTESVRRWLIEVRLPVMGLSDVPELNVGLRIMLKLVTFFASWTR